jgi:hypothetical protein
MAQSAAAGPVSASVSCCGVQETIAAFLVPAAAQESQEARGDLDEVAARGRRGPASSDGAQRGGVSAIPGLTGLDKHCPSAARHDPAPDRYPSSLPALCRRRWAARGRLTHPRNHEPWPWRAVNPEFPSGGCRTDDGHAEFLPGPEVRWLSQAPIKPPPLPQITAKASGLLIDTRSVPMQPSQAAMPGRAEMVNVFEPTPDTGPMIANGTRAPRHWYPRGGLRRAPGSVPADVRCSRARTARERMSELCRFAVEDGHRCFARSQLLEQVVHHLVEYVSVVVYGYRYPRAQSAQPIHGIGHLHPGRSYWYREYLDGAERDNSDNRAVSRPVGDPHRRNSRRFALRLTPPPPRPYAPTTSRALDRPHRPGCVLTWPNSGRSTAPSRLRTSLIKVG